MDGNLESEERGQRPAADAKLMHGDEDRALGVTKPSVSLTFPVNLSASCTSPK
jgi:hypothetical protein